MKRFIFILIFVFAFIGFNEIKSFDNTMESIKALNDTVQACQVDMQNNKDLICD